MKQTILIVDDEALVREALKLRLEDTGEFTVDIASSGEDAVKLIQADPQKYSLILMDYRLKTESGAKVTEKLLAVSPNLTILMLSGDNSREALKDSWASGAVGFLEKATDDEEFLRTIRSWCRPHPKENFGSPDGAQIDISELGLVGHSRTMQEVAKKLIRYRDNNESVLLLGETGTGKERVAKALHSGLKEKFFAVNCASFGGDTELMESDLFGHQKGAFTGAIQDHPGIFRSANNGTVFLDEIHTLSLKAQQKLLRCLQEKTVRPIGAVKEFPVQFRLIAAAKPNLLALIEKGEFLPDLYERLNVLTIEIPPLRDRKEDIPVLAEYFCQKYVKETQNSKNLSPEVIVAFLTYDWPRNVRELENTVRRLCIDSEQEWIGPEHLDDRFAPTKISSNPLTMRDKVSSLMKAQILNALKTGQSQRAAARSLGIPESSFRRLMKRLEL